ncbi:MAG: transposase [Myxococcales bacterium]|nr:transposase [Myxococcales bacterium]
MLEGTNGVLLVDGYSGYNDVEKVSSRRGAACFAHVRRYFFESIKTAPGAQDVLDRHHGALSRRALREGAATFRSLTL